MVSTDVMDELARFLEATTGDFDTAYDLAQAVAELIEAQYTLIPNDTEAP